MYVGFRPVHGVDIDALNAMRKFHLRRLHNSWWLTRRALKGNAKVVYGTVYEIDKSLGQFDVVTLGSVLLHLRDPFLALQRAASVCSKTIIVSDAAEEVIFASEPEMLNKMTLFFLPRAETKAPFDTWYYTSSTVMVEFLKILGFESTKVTKHLQKSNEGICQYYTVVGERAENAADRSRARQLKHLMNCLRGNIARRTITMQL